MVWQFPGYGQPVSMASSARSVHMLCGVSYVYTPPALRRRGYASSCVASVSQSILDQGFARCALYTDLASPISNSSYQKIGYRPGVSRVIHLLDECCNKCSGVTE